MLMVTPAALARLRSESRAPVSLAGSGARPAKKLSRHRREAIIYLLAKMMREAEPTAFALEGPGRAAIRARLCEARWTWSQADATAAEVVQAALARVGARRPDWKQGQPEYTQDGHIPRTRERCARCAKPLPEHKFRYCGPICAKAAKLDQKARQDKDELNAKHKIYMSAWTEKQPARECKLCGKSFKPKLDRQKYCSTLCGREAGGFARRNVRMVCEEL